MHTELLNRKAWRTRLELANAIFEYLELFHNAHAANQCWGRAAPSSTRNYTRKPHCHARNSQHPTPRNPGHIIQT